jgi:hypothetical protein
MADETHPAAGDADASFKLTIAVDKRDVALAVGSVMALAGAASFHWGAALFVAGAAVAAFALKLSR